MSLFLAAPNALHCNQRDHVEVASCLFSSDGSFEEETQRGTGERSGESQEAKQWGGRLSDSTSSPAVSNFKSVFASVVKM